MKRTVFGMIVCVIFLTSSISVATSMNKPTARTMTLDDDVPVWQVGNSWTYTMNNFTVNYNEDGQQVYMNGKIDEFTWTVTNTSDSTYYTVEFTGKLTATYNIDISSISGNVQLQGNFKPRLAHLKGTIIFTKSDLKIHHFTVEIKGWTKVIISPFTFALPIPFKVTADGQLSTDFPLFNFPLSSNKYWTMPELDVTIQASAGGIFGFVQFPMTLVTYYSWTPFAFHCQAQQDITVPAGTFSAYKISSIFGDYFDYYYAPSVGNLIKIDAIMQNGEAHAELASMNYP